MRHHGPKSVFSIRPGPIPDGIDGPGTNLVTLIVVGTVSLISMAVGACGFYLAQRVWRWRKNEIKESSQGAFPKEGAVASIEGSEPVKEFSGTSVK